MRTEKSIMATVGMPGCGKGLASQVAREVGLPVFACGDIIREEVERRGLAPTPENVGKIMLKIREEEGVGVVASRLIPRIDANQSNAVLVEGIRNIEEVNILEKHYSRVTVAAIHASAENRFNRLRTRSRSDDPKTWKEFDARDKRELDVGIGKVIALADKMLVNEGSIQKFKTNFAGLLREALKLG